MLSIYHLLFTVEVESRKKLYATKWSTVGILAPLGYNAAQIDSYRRLGTTYRSHILAPSRPRKVRNYQFTVRKIPQERRSYESWNFNSGNYLFTTDTK